MEDCKRIQICWNGLLDEASCLSLPSRLYNHEPALRRFIVRDSLDLGSRVENAFKTNACNASYSVYGLEVYRPFPSSEKTVGCVFCTRITQLSSMVQDSIIGDSVQNGCVKTCTTNRLYFTRHVFLDQYPTAAL